MRAMHTVSELKAMEEYQLFPRLSPEAVAVWRNYGEEIEVASGAPVLIEGDSLYPFLIVLAGEVQVVKRMGQQDILLARHQSGNFLGEITILAGAPCPATAIAQTAARLLVIPSEVFRELVAKRLPEAIDVVRALAVRSAEIGAIGRQQEKLASIGKIAAGLSHELNNPASSICRQAAVLKAELLRNQELVLSAKGYDVAGRQAVAGILRQPQCTSHKSALHLLNEIDALTAWLSNWDVPDAASHAANLAEYGIKKDSLAALSERLDTPMPDAIEWLGNTAILLAAADSIEDGSKRISDIVSRMRHYSHLDQSPVLDVDLHKEIEATLGMFEQRLHGIEVSRSYCETVPRLSVFATELNQVWTNLIDNALDAMPDGGSLRIATSCDSSFVQVEFTDSGTGIAPEIQHCIFDPFFTTKDVGQGFGLGLDYVYRTVVRRHSGEVRFASNPGETRFCVHLPISGSLPVAQI